MLDRKLFEVHERRGLGVGRFLDSAEFAKCRGIPTSDRLSTLAATVILCGYVGEATIPAKFNVPMRTGRRYFGVLVLWAR